MLFKKFFGENGWNWSQKDAKDDIEAYDKKNNLKHSARQAFFLFINLIGSLIIRIFVEHWCFECRFR